MPWDRDSYRRNVLEPARRAGNVPPADLYQRYGLPADAASAEAIDRRIAEVVDYWRELRGDRVLETLAQNLIGDHRNMEADGPLTARKLADLLENRRLELRERLASHARAMAGAETHAGAETVASLLGVFGGAVTRAEVEAALRDAGVEVIDTFPALPAAPHSQLSALAGYVQQLGWQLSPEIIFGDHVRGGFRIIHGFQLSDGRSLDEETVDRAWQEACKGPYLDPATAPTQKALTIMRKAAGQAGGIDELVLSEVVERLRRFVGRGLRAQRLVAAHAADLGLASDEAGLLAAAVLAEDTTEGVRQQVEEKLAAGLLREAQALSAGLPAGDPLRTRAAEADAAVARLVQAADAYQNAGRIEQAAERLVEAIALARDDGVLVSRLAELPPPPPTAADARPNGPGMLVTWEPSAARAGRLRYTVVRCQDRAPVSAADGTVVVSNAEGTSATDTHPPAGVALHYGVFADRGSNAYSAAAETPPRMFVPDVTIISVTEQETSVAVSWCAHEGTAGIRVVRREQREPRDAEDGTAVPASLTGFTDRGLRTGKEYLYRITAVYRTPGGRRRLSPGVVVPGTPEHEPDPVTDLTAEVADADGDAASGGAVVLRWTPPRHGQVRLVRADHPPSWPAGTRVPPLAELSQVQGEPRTGPAGRAVLHGRLPFGRHFITALSESGQTTVAGCTVELRLVEPVHDQCARRMSDAALIGRDTVRITCAWPEDDKATQIIVRYPGGELTCSRRTYFQEGGCTVPADRHAADFWIVAVYLGSDGPLTAPPVKASVPARPAAVHYEIGRVALRRRQRTVQVSAEETARLPPLVMVQADGTYPPASAAEGQRVHGTEGQQCQPGQPVRITVSLPHLGRGWLACFVDPDRTDPDADPILLFHPPADQMRIP